MPAGLQPNNPYTLFLIFILLLLSIDPSTKEKLALLKSFLSAVQQTTQVLQSGWQAWRANMERLFPEEEVTLRALKK